MLITAQGRSRRDRTKNSPEPILISEEPQLPAPGEDAWSRGGRSQNPASLKREIGERGSHESRAAPSSWGRLHSGPEFAGGQLTVFAVCPHCKLPSGRGKQQRRWCRIQEYRQQKRKEKKQQPPVRLPRAALAAAGSTPPGGARRAAATQKRRWGGGGARREGTRSGAEEPLRGERLRGRMQDAEDLTLLGNSWKWLPPQHRRGLRGWGGRSPPRGC